uniref:CCHC-type domain-containing protein n=1 Tax=Ditylenchus dipsaci TaxID=166011 RepID=A0A915E1Q2_9BILA
MEDQEITNGFANFFRSEIEFEIDKELLNYNQKRQKIILKAETKAVIEAIEQADFSKSATPELETEHHLKLAPEENAEDQLEEKARLIETTESAASISSLAEENLPEDADDTLDDLDKELLNQQNDGADEEIPQNNLEGEHPKKLSDKAAKSAPETDNIVVTRTYDNFIQVTEIASRERNFRLSFRNAKVVMNLLDQEFFPLIEQQGAGKRVYHTISFTQHTIYLFRQKLVEKIKEFEAQKAKFCTRPLSEVIKVEFIEDPDALAVQHLTICMLDEGKTQNLVLSVPAVYRTVYYLQNFEKIMNKVKPAEAITHWAEEKDYRHEFTLSYVDNKLCLTITKEAIGQQEEEVKNTLVIPSSLIGSFEKQLFQSIKNSGACMNCGKKGHRMNSCAKENNYIISYSRVNFYACYKCGLLGHFREACLQLKEDFQLDIAQCSSTQTIDPVKTVQTGSWSKDSSNSSDQDENKPEMNRRTIPSECESNQSDVLSTGHQKIAEFKGREVLVEVVSNACGKQLIRVDQIGTKASRFFISLKKAKGFVDILKDEFIPKYNSIEDKSAISSENQYICKRYLKEGNIEFELAFVLNRFHYIVQIVEVIPINGNYIKHTVVLPAMEMKQFVQKLENSIEEAEQASTNLKRTVSNEADKDDGFFEPATLDSNKTQKKMNEESSSLTPVAKLQMFIKEYDSKHYIGICDSKSQKLHLSMPVANRCIFYIDEFHKFWKSKGTLSMELDQWVKEDDCQITQDSFSVAAHALLALHQKLLKKMDISGACRQCGLITHPSRHCENRSVMDFSRIYNKGACYQCGALGHYSKDCPKGRNDFNNGPRTSKDNGFAMSSKNDVGPSTSSAMTHSAVEDGLELKVVKLSKSARPMFLVDIQQATDKEAQFMMSITVAKIFVKRLETTFIPFCKKMDLKDIAGLTKELINQSIELAIRAVSRWKKIHEAYKQSINPPTFVSFASAQEVERAKKHELDDDNEVTLLWKDNRCYLLISTIRAKKSKIQLPLADLKEFVIMLKSHQQYYESLSDKEAKQDQIKILKETHPIVEGKVERTVVVSGHAIRSFIVQIDNLKFESNACFRCSRSGHRSSDCDQQIFRHKHCYKCGSFDHFHRNCTDDKLAFLDMIQETISAIFAMRVDISNENAHNLLADCINIVALKPYCGQKIYTG